MKRVICTLLIICCSINQCKTQLLCNALTDISRDVISPKCLKQISTVCKNVGLQWKFFDASSKFLTSGMSYSNVIDYGNFPECMSIEHNDSNGKILGKYCAFSIFIINIFIPDVSRNFLLKYNIDTNVTTPQIVSINTLTAIEKDVQDIIIPVIPFAISKYSSCIPDACTPQEIGDFYLIGRVPLKLIFFTDLIPCETKESNTDLDYADILSITFLSGILLLMIASTAYDGFTLYNEKKPYHEIMLAFSILTNGAKLLKTSNNKTEQIQCFNGMRFISMMWVVAFHAVAPFQAGAVGISNFPLAKEWDRSWTNRYILSALLAVDTFFFITGFLLAFSYIKSTAGQDVVKQVSKVPMMYVHRYLRLTPPAAAIFLVTITIYRFLGAGPFWTLLTGQFRTICKTHWWQFFLYIQNYSNPDAQCINPLWYLSADMQLFILSPIVLIPTSLYIRKYYKPVIITLCSFTVFWILCPMFIRYFVDEGAGNVQNTHDRFNNYLIGMTFGAIMRLKKNEPFIFKPLVNFSLWIAVIIVSLAFNIYWFDVLNNYSLGKYTLFMGFYKPVWCLSLCFMVYSCYHNHGGFIQWLLTRKIFQVVGKLSYSMYVVHIMVLMYVLGTNTTNVAFSNYILFYNWCGHITVTMLVSLLWVLAFEYPVVTIEKYLTSGFTAKKKIEKI